MTSLQALAVLQELLPTHLIFKNFMNKINLVQSFISLIEKTLALAIQSQQATVDYVTHEDNKPENQYDTRGLEASYLARGQAERVADLKECLSFFKNTLIQSYTAQTPIGNTALVEIFSTGDRPESKNLLMMPKGGGMTLNFENKSIQIVTASSPLGKSLVGKKVGDEISYKSGDKIREYEILSVL